jgi:hypothetical protein
MLKTNTSYGGNSRPNKTNLAEDLAAPPLGTAEATAPAARRTREHFDQDGFQRAGHLRGRRTCSAQRDAIDVVRHRGGARGS